MWCRPSGETSIPRIAPFEFAGRCGPNQTEDNNMSTNFLSLILSIFLLHPNPPSPAEMLKVRVISEKDAKPMKNQPVTLSLLYDSTQKAPSGAEMTMRAQTDSGGEASFALPQPTPAHLGVQVHLTSDNWRCACSMLASTEDVIRKGVTVTAANPKSTSSTRTDARPGEILFSARPLGFFERLLEPLVKQ